ncbi:MAG: alpha/beta fold hydrolase [Rubrivivax sp.]
MQRTEPLDGLTLIVDEPEGAAPRGTVLMLHGWPDSAALWDGSVAALADAWRCVRLTLPGFDDGDGRVAPTLDEVTTLIGRALDHVSPEAPVTLLLHDWGCVFGYHWARLHPQRVQRVIGVDIGDAGSRAHVAGLGWRAKVGIAGYQLWLALACRIGGALGDRMAQRLAAAMRVPPPLSRIRARMGWPYVAAWSGGLRATRPFEPQVPMLFVYGGRKPFLFHSQAWADTLAARPGSRVLGLKTGHWVMLDAPQDFHAALRGWLDG